MKKLVIDKCSNCPFVKHSGGFGNVAYMPSCGNMGGRKLPYTEHSGVGRITAHVTDLIPEWCPLDDA